MILYPKNMVNVVLMPSGAFEIGWCAEVSVSFVAKLSLKAVLFEFLGTQTPGLCHI